MARTLPISKDRSKRDQIPGGFQMKIPKRSSYRVKSREWMRWFYPMVSKEGQVLNMTNPDKIRSRWRCKSWWPAQRRSLILRTQVPNYFQLFKSHFFHRNHWPNFDFPDPSIHQTKSKNQGPEFEEQLDLEQRPDPTYQNPMAKQDPRTTESGQQPTQNFISYPETLSEIGQGQLPLETGLSQGCWLRLHHLLQTWRLGEGTVR